MTPARAAGRSGQGVSGIDPYAAPPLYRVWPGRKRTLLVQLYEGTADDQDD